MARKVTVSEASQPKSPVTPELASGSDGAVLDAAVPSAPESSLAVGSAGGGAIDSPEAGSDAAASGEQGLTPIASQSHSVGGAGATSLDASVASVKPGADDQAFESLEDGHRIAAPDAQSPINPNPPTVTIYPSRSYMDADELRRRGGPAYTVPRRHGEELVRRKLASYEPQEK